MMKGIVSMLTLAALGGCAAIIGGPTEVTVSSLMTAPALLQGQIDPFSASGPNTLKVGDSYNQLAIFNLRSCNDDKTDCKVGKGKLQSKTTVLGLSRDEATVRVDLHLDVGGSQTVHDKVSNTGYQLHDVPLKDQVVTSKTIRLNYNASRHIGLPYGEGFNVCVEGTADPAGNVMHACQPLRGFD
ncbi:hypothetical protein BKM09_013480 [Pseudomonas amygdali pv. morsprunorum]|nr:hypothetical protein [Pseudomonas amygdali]POY82161.1 hypothetical protein BKM09_013480 [Pseudomonas amygdali pv. morsprunorum]